jgi:hypothetical protein
MSATGAQNGHEDDAERYGGYSSWCAITRFPKEIVAAAAPICGMTDLVVDYPTTRPDIRPYSEEMMGSPATAPERYRERSPIHYVDRIEGRLLIVQGANDPNVTQLQNIVLALAEVSGTGWITSQCSTTLPLSRRKMSTTASPAALSERPCQ